MKKAIKGAWLVCGLAAAGHAEAAVPLNYNYGKLLDLQAVREKHLPATIETVHPQLRMEIELDEDSEVARQAMSPTIIEEPAMAVETEGDLYGLTWTEWGIFMTGLFLGLTITFATTGLASAISPCLAMWAQVTATSYSFYVYMKIYEESNFDNTEAMAMMILNMIAWGDALNSGACGAGQSHGFWVDTGHSLTNVHDFISFGRHKLEEKNSGSGGWKMDPFWEQFVHWLKPFGQEAGGLSSDEIWVAVGILGVAQAIAAYADYRTFQDRWEAKEYFDSGTFLGKAIIEAFIVLYLILLAQAATSNSLYLLLE